jgi:hypothetical protein
VDYYDIEYRRQYCQERIARMREDYRRAQAPKRDERRRVEMIWAVWKRIREPAARAPAYRA